MRKSIVAAAFGGALASGTIMAVPPVAHAEPDCLPGQVSGPPAPVCNTPVPGLFGHCSWASGAALAACISGVGPQTPRQFQAKQDEDNCWANAPGGDPSTGCPARGSWKNP